MVLNLSVKRETTVNNVDGKDEQARRPAGYKINELSGEKRSERTGLSDILHFPVLISEGS